MERIGRRTVLCILLIGLTAVCLVVLSEDATAIERPLDRGPYNVGYFDVTLNVTKYTQNWSLDCRYYYPALTDGEGTDPDPSGAPYPPIIHRIFFHTSLQPYWNRTNDRDTLEYVVSHGFIVVAYTPLEAIILPDDRSFYNDLVYHTDSYNVNGTSPLHGMVKVDEYGCTGAYWGGSQAFLLADSTDRVTAVCCLSPYFGAGPSGLDWSRWRKNNIAWMVQKGGDRTDNEQFLDSIYEEAPPDKMLVTVPSVGLEGPFRLDLVVAFFLYYLGGDGGYEEYLYGNDSHDEVYTGQVGLEYVRDGGDSFKLSPNFTVQILSTVYMDDIVELNVTWESYVLMEHPTLVHEWYIGDMGVPYATSSNGPNITASFTDPGDIYYIRYRYIIGNISIYSDIASTSVRNRWPVANAGSNRTVFQDEYLELDGSDSWDTPSDIGTLLYNWSGIGITSRWSLDPTIPIDTSVLGTFTVSLLVMDRHEKVSSPVSVTISIVNVPPSVIVADLMVDEDQVVNLTGVGIDSVSHMDALEFRWVFDDGTSSGWSSSPDLTRSFTRSGRITIALEVRDPVGATNRTAILVTVANVVPTAEIERPREGAKADLGSRVEFTGWGMDTPSDEGNLWYTWDFDDGSTSGGPEASHSFEEAGRYTVTLTVEDDDDATAVVTINLTIEEAQPPIEGPQVAALAACTITLLGLLAVVATEPGKYWLGLLGAPLFTRSKDVMDNRTRHALHGIIVENPGIHYNAIREEHGLANGQAAYHLSVLEREGFVRSVRDGKLKRFYSIHTKVPDDVGMSPEGTREAIVDLVRRRPGINQLGVMEELGLDRDRASYYLRELVKGGELKASKKGWYTVYTVRRG